MDTYTILYTYYTAVEIRPKTKCLHIIMNVYILYTYNNIMHTLYIRVAGAVSS